MRREAETANKIGVIEIFFGPAWSTQSRFAYARFLKENGFGFYIYGPKSDAMLRKHWAENWSGEYRTGLRKLAQAYHEQSLTFGVALSPYGLQEEFSSKSERLLKEKVGVLEDLGVGILGVFFDDMPNSPGLAARQIEIVKAIQSFSSTKIVFCPSFYSFDPILDRVFGQRDPEYLNEIGEGIPGEVEIMWTGPKVISEEIPEDHLVEVTKILQRKPFICDNIFANDGPKNCKFIKLRSPGGRNRGALAQSSYWSFNPMNQPELSKIVVMAAKMALEGRAGDQDWLLSARERYCSSSFSKWLGLNRDLLLQEGLDKISDADKGSMIKTLKQFTDPSAADLVDWLEGKYVVGNECLTD